MKIDVLVPRQAPPEHLRDYFELACAAFAVDRPDAPPPSYEQMVARISQPPSEIGEYRFWAARGDGALLGVAIVWLPAAANGSVAVVDLRVAPGVRRRGIGTELLKTILPELRELGREVVTAQGVTVGGDGEKWAEFAGFRKVQRFVIQTLFVEEVDPARWSLPVPDGYITVRWISEAPEDLLASLADAYGAMHDAPTGDMTYQEPEWTPDLIRASEASARDRGGELRTVAAVHVETGQVAGLTQVELHPGMPDYGMQLDTAVVAAHRGRRLGIAIKADMMRWLMADKPELRRIATNIAADNPHMGRVNEAIGYRTTREMVDVELETEALQRRFG